MTAVVLRCPVCGTTQSNVGECEACFDGTVAYYCGNHRPGRWLDGPACNQCGATLGEPPPLPSVPAPDPDPPRSRRPPAGGIAAGGSGPRIPPRRPATAEEEAADPHTPEATLAEVLVKMVEEGERRRGDGADVRWREPVATPLRVPGMGCVGRLLLLVLVLFALGAAGILSLFAGLMY